MYSSPKSLSFPLPLPCFLSLEEYIRFINAPQLGYVIPMPCHAMLSLSVYDTSRMVSREKPGAWALNLTFGWIIIPIHSCGARPLICGARRAVTALRVEGRTSWRAYLSGRRASAVSTVE